MSKNKFLFVSVLALSTVLHAHAQTPTFQPLAVQPTRPVAAAQSTVAAPTPVAPAATPTFQPLAVQPTRPVAAQTVAPVQTAPVSAPAPAVAQPTFQPLAVQPTLPTTPTPPVTTAQPIVLPANAPPLPQPGVPLQSATPAQPKVVTPVQPVAQPIRQPAAPVVVPQQPVARQPAPPPTVPTAMDTVSFPVYPEYTSGTAVALDPEWEENKLDKGKLATRKESDGGGFALGARVGTMGIGADATVGLLSRLNFRGGVGYGSFTWKPKFGDIKYDMDVDLISVPLMLDWHPFGTGFRISAGAYIQPGTKAKLTATPDRFIQIGSHRYNPELLGEISGEVEPKSPVAPYLGIGYGNAISKDGRLTFSFDLGVIYQRYDVSLDANGTVATLYPEVWKKDIQTELDAIQDDFDKFPFYPILNFGIAFRF